MLGQYFCFRQLKQSIDVIRVIQTQTKQFLPFFFNFQVLLILFYLFIYFALFLCVDSNFLVSYSTCLKNILYHFLQCRYATMQSFSFSFQGNYFFLIFERYFHQGLNCGLFFILILTLIKCYINAFYVAWLLTRSLL